MERILRLMQEKLIRGQRCMLVTVLSRQDSAPRDAGAAMLLTEDGLIGGTIGGGAIEALAMDMAHRCLEQRRSLLRRFNLSKDAGMICGGAMALFFQFADDPLPLPGPGERGWLLTDIAADGTWTARFTSQLDHHPGQVAFDGRTLRCPIGQNMRVWIFGAGHVAQALSALLQELDFDCVILDDRESFACAERFPNAAQVRVVDLSRLSLDISANDAVCIMTRGHQFDYEVLCQMLNTPAGYLGLMGSRSKVAETQRRLRADGFSQRQIDPIHMPIGMDISSDTPMEIAVSIAGELIHHRARLQNRERTRQLQI